MTHDEVLELLRTRIKKAGTLTAASAQLGISKSLLSLILSPPRPRRQHRAIGFKLLKALGLKRKITRTYEYTAGPPIDVMIQNSGVVKGYIERKREGGIKKDGRGDRRNYPNGRGKPGPGKGAYKRT